MLVPSSVPCAVDSDISNDDIPMEDRNAPTFTDGGTLAIPALCKVIGDGRVQILPATGYTEALCQGNCSIKGATCVALDLEAKIGACICPNGVMLNHLNPQCTNGK